MELQREYYYTCEEFFKIDENNKYELTEGSLYMMSSPSNFHQAISTELLIQIGTFLRGKACQVTHDFNVRLWNDKDTVYIPDIIVVCDKTKMTENACVGAPDFIIEITSPSTASRDYLIKLNEYKRAGVKEYWIVDTENRKVFVNILKNGEYQLSTYTFDDSIPVETLAGCVLSLSSMEQ